MTIKQPIMLMEKKPSNFHVISIGPINYGTQCLKGTILFSKEMSVSFVCVSVGVCV